MTENNNQVKSSSVRSNAMSTTTLQGGLDEQLKGGYSIVELGHSEAAKIGLPLDACSEGHYLKAHLFVTESGTTEKLQSNRKVGQTIVLTSCNDGHTGIYSRTGEFGNHGAVEWQPWSPVSDGALNVVWGAGSSMNNHVTGGTYNITGQRLNAADGLPIANSNPGHTIHARLLVLDSSIPGTGDNDDKCVTQILTLSNRTGGDGDVYVRTGRASSKNQLAGGYGWEPWGKLQQNIEVGQVTSLDSYTGNGIYSGVHTDGNTLFETFVMVVINNYAVAGATGKVRSISQFKYALNVDATFSYKTRTGQGNTGIEWGNWVDLGAAKTTDIQDGAVTAQKLSADVREKVDNPLRPLYIAAGAEYNDTGADKTKTAPWGETVIHKAGHYYLNGLGDITEEQMIDIYNASNFYALSKNMQAHFAYTDMRTNICRNSVGWSTIVGSVADAVLMFYNSKIEIAVISNFKWTSDDKYCFQAGDVSTMFDYCNNLKRIIGVIQVTEYTKGLNSIFSRCPVLISVKLKGVNVNITIKDSPYIDKASILYMIQNATSSSAITITLHPDAYARLADDADIVAALEEQPLVSLVSA